MSLFRWAMKRGAAILFVLSLLIFVTSLVTQVMSGTGGAYTSFAAELNPNFPRAWFFLLAFIGALSSSALPFFGACLIDRADRALSRKEAAE
jgi:hypothetical protein